MSIQETGARVVLNVHTKKSGIRQNFPDSIALIFSLYTYHFNFTFNCQTSHDMIELSLYLVPHHCSTSTVFLFYSCAPVTPSCDLLNTGHFTEQGLSGYVVFCWLVFKKLLNPILSVVTLIMWRNICLDSFHCSYFKQYTSFMFEVKKVKIMCGILWQYETPLLWNGKELTGNKIPYR